jgi:hypothetical protein
VLNRLDDFPVHQTPEPLAHVATGDRNAYDRYFFNGYAGDGSLFFAVAFGVYPNRFVQDAHLSVVRDGVQTSLHASRRAAPDRTDTAAGPIRIEVVEPMRRLRVTAGPNEAGLEADLTFVARTEAVEEPRFTHRSGTRVTMDYTRFTQFGAYEGWLAVDGERLDVGGLLGSRDRSWGIRSVGEREAGAPGGAPQFFWLWAPLSFDDACLHFDVQEDAAGRRWHRNGVVVPLLGEGEPAPVDDVDHRIAWRPGTRRSDGAVVRMGEHEVELEPVLDFQMLGIGYLHPEWNHGTWKGEEAVGAERWELAGLEPLAPQHLHVQQLVRARWGERTGVGVLEQLVIGPHEPSGFRDLLDGAGSSAR